MDEKQRVRLAVVALLLVQLALIVTVLRHESLTFDESDHMFAGYSMWKRGDYGINPEHPPLVKLLAAVPLLHEALWMPPPQRGPFKRAAYVDGKAWMETNDGGSQRLVLRMRLAAGLLAIALALVVFFATREWFGLKAGLIALTFVVFDPNLLAHSGLVTTDIAASLFFLASIYTFYRYVRQPSWQRLVVTGVTVGLLLAAKHSGVLLAPMLLALITCEGVAAPRGERMRTTMKLCGAFVALGVIAVAALWAFYGFRYAARPAGLELNPSLAEYASSLTAFQQHVFAVVARFHLLPESYIYGLVDVKVGHKDASSFVLGRWYPRAVLWYFPAILSIKTTLGLLAGVVVAVYAFLSSRGERDRLQSGARTAEWRPGVYVLVPAAVYLAAAMSSEMSIGVRHILPVYVLGIVFASGGLARLMERSRRWTWVAVLLLCAHAASALTVFPAPMAYANEAWGGARNAHFYLNDSNVDWGQQLYQVKRWQDRHPGEACWFAYQLQGAVSQETYGVHCHVLPTAYAMRNRVPCDPDTPPAVIHGTLLLSAGQVEAPGWGGRERNPYLEFEKRRPDEEIDYGVLEYRGEVHIEAAAALQRVCLSGESLRGNKPEQALALAEDAARMNPDNFYVEKALGDAAVANGKVDEARGAYEAASARAGRLDAVSDAAALLAVQSALQKL